MLGLLLWKRPLVGTSVAALAGLHVLCLLFLAPSHDVVPLSVHGALVFTVLFTWGRGEWRWNALFFVLGCALYVFVGCWVGSLLSMNDATASDMNAGLLAGMGIALLRAVGASSAPQKEGPTPDPGQCAQAGIAACTSKPDRRRAGVTRP